MRRQTIGFLVGAGALLATAAPGAGQARPDTDFSQSSSSSGPTCVVGGVASDCGGGEASAFPVAVGVAPVFVAPSLDTASDSALLVGGVFGGTTSGDVSSDVDVDRSTSFGTTATR